MRFLLAICALVCLLDGGSAWAQYSSGMGGSSSRQSSTRSGSSIIGGTRNLGSGGVQAGQRTLSGGSGQGAAMEQLGNNSGQLTGSERYVRGNRQAGQFVGGDAGDTAFIGSAGGGGLSGGGYGGSALQGPGFNNAGFNRQANRGNQSNRTARQGANNRQIRTTLQLGFTPPAPNTAASGQRLTGVLQRSSRIQAVTPIEVAVVGRVAVLRGTVASSGDRDLAQQVVLLEPGISRIQNDLVVAGQSSEELPAPMRVPE